MSRPITGQAKQNPTARDESIPLVWEEWFTEEAWKVLAFARKLTRSAVDSEDLLQECLVEFWALGYRDAPPPLPLVFSKIRLRAIDLGRKRSSQKLREERYCSQSHGIGEAQKVAMPSDPDRAWRFDQIRKAMDLLPQKNQMVVVLRVWGELSFSEIGKVLEITTFSASSLYRRSLRKLRPLLGEQESELMK